MPTLTYPGVYIQEISSGVRPVEVASTSTPAFVGLAEMGPTDAKRITNWTEFQRYFGSFIADSQLAHGVLAFFNNGGRQCYIVRVLHKDATAATVTVQNRASPSVAGLKFSAKSKGAWGNYLYLQLEDGTLDPGNEFKVSVRRQTDKVVVPPNFKDITSVEVFDNLSMDPSALNYVVNVLKQNSNLIEAEVAKENVSLQNGIHRGGLEPLFDLGAKLKFQINVNGDGFQEVTLAAPDGGFTDLEGVRAAIQTAVRDLPFQKNPQLRPPLRNSLVPLSTIRTIEKPRLILMSGTKSARLFGARPAGSHE